MCVWDQLLYKGNDDVGIRFLLNVFFYSILYSIYIFLNTKHHKTDIEVENMVWCFKVSVIQDTVNPSKMKTRASFLYSDWD